jgi:hypothetical protein
MNCSIHIPDSWIYLPHSSFITWLGLLFVLLTLVLLTVLIRSKYFSQSPSDTLHGRPVKKNRVRFSAPPRPYQGKRVTPLNSRCLSNTCRHCYPPQQPAPRIVKVFDFICRACFQHGPCRHIVGSTPRFTYPCRACTTPNCLHYQNKAQNRPGTPIIVPQNNLS